MNRILLAAVLVLTAACAHHARQLSVIPKSDEVKVSRDAAGEDCKEIGPINGTTSSANGTREQALEDLKKDAAAKGANYVMIKQYSAYGTSVVGVAYDCP
jgi:hypothetical protein